MYSTIPPRRAPGMQVHAVPEAERAVDASGRRLPWGYEYSQLANEQTPPVESGSFGKSMRRSTVRATRSRSKTTEAGRGEGERAKADNLAAEEAVFGALRRPEAKEGGNRDALGDIDPNAANAVNSAAAPSVTTRLPHAAAELESEPTEVILFGFGDDLSWAAIDFYERVSNGVVLEDYERAPPGSRYDVSRSFGRQAANKTLSRAAMKKKNATRNGSSWVKITFDSRRAAELAIARSPHIIKGYLVYAEYFQGRGPQRDEPIFATQAGAQLTSDVLPPTFSTEYPTGSPNASSDTITSATATAPQSAPDGAAGRARGFPPWNAPLASQTSPTNSSSTLQNDTYRRRQVPLQSAAPADVKTSSFQPRADAPLSLTPMRRGCIEGTSRAVVLPAELALAPKQPKASWTSWLGTGEIIGGAVPRREDGTFDWDRASLYWRFFYWIDCMFGIDLCGFKADE